MKRVFPSFRSLLFVLALLSLPAHSEPGGEEEYDRLDGVGASGKKVDVIEWEGSLEIHVYPAHTLAGLAMKLDKALRGGKVMVIGYRFTNAPENGPHPTRAVLGIPLTEPFHTYYEDMGEYDKVTITNNVLQLGGKTGLREFALDPEPTQLYPDGHPALKAPPQAAPSEDAAPAAEAAPAGAEGAKPQADPEAVKEFSW